MQCPLFQILKPFYGQIPDILFKWFLRKLIKNTKIIKNYNKMKGQTRITGRMDF